MSLACYKYRLPFKKALKTSTATFDYREGLILVYTDNGQQYFGEAAPLPGFSNETLQEIESLLPDIREKVEELFNSSFTTKTLCELYKTKSLPPSLQFGLDSIGYQILAKRNGTPLHEQLFNTSKKAVAINALGNLHSDNYLANVQKFIAEGYQTIKFKIGINFEQELQKLHNVRSTYPELTIRLDANQAWSVETAIENCQSLEPLAIEYCEEPLEKPSPANFEKLEQKTVLPLALDESLSQVSYWPNLLPYTAFIILKPMLIGSFKKNLETKRLANTHENKVVYTTCLESGIGRWVTAVLASGSGHPNTAHGLATGHLYDKDVLSDNTYISNGMYHLSNHNALMEINIQQLQKISSKLF